MKVENTQVSRTERFCIYDKKKIVSRLYIRDKDDGGAVFLFRLKTNKSHRNKGLAKQLINSAIKKYKDRGITLRACGQDGGPSTTTLLKMYRKFGFKRKSDTKTMYYDN